MPRRVASSATTLPAVATYVILPALRSLSTAPCRPVSPTTNSISWITPPTLVPITGGDGPMDIATVRSVRGTSQMYQMQVHDRYTTGTSPAQPDRVPVGVHTPGTPCDMTPPLVQRPDPPAASLARHRASLPPGGGRRALGHRLGAASMGMARADPAARPGRGYEQGQPAACQEQNGEEPTGRHMRPNGHRRAGGAV